MARLLPWAPIPHARACLYAQADDDTWMIRPAGSQVVLSFARRGAGGETPLTTPVGDFSSTIEAMIAAQCILGRLGLDAFEDIAKRKDLRPVTRVRPDDALARDGAAGTFILLRDGIITDLVYSAGGIVTYFGNLYSRRAMGYGAALRDACQPAAATDLEKLEMLALAEIMDFRLSPEFGVEARDMEAGDWETWTEIRFPVLAKRHVSVGMRMTG